MACGDGITCEPMHNTLPVRIKCVEMMALTGAAVNVLRVRHVMTACVNVWLRAQIWCVGMMVAADLVVSVIR